MRPDQERLWNREHQQPRMSPRRAPRGAQPEDLYRDTELRLTILHTNDEHSALLPHSPAVDHHRERRDPTVGGFARLATAVQEIRRAKEAAGEPVLLLSAGDFLGGSAFNWLALRGLSPELSLMQAMG